MIGLRKEIRVTQTKTGNIDYKSNQTYGGYVQYFKLYFKLIGMAYDNKQMFKGWNAFVMWVNLFFMFFWACLLKPLGQFYSTHTRFHGSYKKVMEDNLVVSHTIKKEKSFKLFNIPFYYYSTSNIIDAELKDLKL